MNPFVNAFPKPVPITREEVDSFIERCGQPEKLPRVHTIWVPDWLPQNERNKLKRFFGEVAL